MVDKSTIRILVLDDEPFMLKLLGRMLANLGFTQVTACDSGRAALDCIVSLNGAPDLILLDLNMPQMDGVEFVRKLVERDYAGSLILVSGEDERVLQTAEKLMHAHGRCWAGCASPLRRKDCPRCWKSGHPRRELASGRRRRVTAWTKFATPSPTDNS